jgi:hypothetical protein
MDWFDASRGRRGWGFIGGEIWREAHGLWADSISNSN